jgi:hypothetical protein
MTIQTVRLGVMIEPSADARIMANALFDKYAAFSQAGFSSQQSFQLTTIFFTSSLYFEEYEEQ